MFSAVEEMQDRDREGAWELVIQIMKTDRWLVCSLKGSGEERKARPDQAGGLRLGLGGGSLTVAVSDAPLLPGVFCRWVHPGELLAQTWKGGDGPQCYPGLRVFLWHILLLACR